MGKHTGERPARDQPRVRGRVALLTTFVTTTLVAWVLLVLAAIDFGRQARSGSPGAWTFLGLASVGAAACLFVTLILGARLVGLMRGRSAPRPVRPLGGRRAAR